MGRLDHQVVMITGIASGIGNAAARLFCRHGATVVGVDINAEVGQALEAELTAQTESFVFYQADVSQESECRVAIQNCFEALGRLDVLYNNAGISEVLPFSDTDAATATRIFAVNFWGTYYLCQQAIPLMLQQGSGTIINTASELAIVAQPLYAAYCASKGAVLSLTRSLALEYARTPIRINALCPGPVQTPMLQQEFDVAAQPDQAERETIATMPIGRLGQPEEIAQVALFLASDAPGLLQGASIVVDGAKTIL